MCFFPETIKKLEGFNVKCTLCTRLLQLVKSNLKNFGRQNSKTKDHKCTQIKNVCLFGIDQN